MRRTMTGLSLLLVATAAAGEQRLKEFSWSKLQAEGRLLMGMVVKPDGKDTWERLRLENKESSPVNFRLLSIEEPDIRQAVYAVRAQVQHEGVEGHACLEMWSYFPGDKKCFSRTLDRRGPMRHLGGTSGWRYFVLPFFVAEGTERPTKLEVNLVLPGRGVVELGPLSLIEYTEGEDPMKLPGQWWGDRDAGLIGGIGGAVIGLLGGTVGLLSGRARAKRVVLAVLKAMTAFGIVCLAAGVVALTQSQPYAVYYPLLLGGGICAAVSLFVLPSVRKRYAALELRQMEARDMAQG